MPSISLFWVHWGTEEVNSPPTLRTASSRGPSQSFFCFTAWRISTCTWRVRCRFFRQLVLLQQRRFNRKLSVSRKPLTFDSTFSACYQIMNCNVSRCFSLIGMLVSVQRILSQYTVTSMLVHLCVFFKRSDDKVWLWYEYNEIYRAIIWTSLALASKL
jgi:hypothetical protein